MKAQSGTYWGRHLKLGFEGSSGGGQLSAACFFWDPSRGWRAAGIPAACLESLPWCRLGYAVRRAETGQGFVAHYKAHSLSLLCQALPVSRQHWVLLVANDT